MQLSWAQKTRDSNSPATITKVSDVRREPPLRHGPARLCPLCGHSGGSVEHPLTADHKHLAHGDAPASPFEHDHFLRGHLGHRIGMPPIP